MFNFLRRLFAKSMPPQGPTSTAGYSTPFIDSYRRVREPSAQELLRELKNTAWSCASINASTCASFPPRLYVTTKPGQPQPKCATKALSPTHPLVSLKAAGQAVAEVLDHPLLTLFQQVNPTHNAFDLWELTQLYLEVHGCAYWLLDIHPLLGTPQNIWILPSQLVIPRRTTASTALVDYYEYRSPSGVIQHYRSEEIIAFRNPDSRDPYTSGLSPLRACFEQVALTSEYAAMKRAIYDNTGIPSVIISPDEVIGDEERDRIEAQWNQKFRRGGMGKVLVAESKMNLQILSHSMGDLAALAEAKATKEDIANAFHIPTPYLSGDTNLANMQAAELFHMKLAIRPRLKRRDQKLTEQLLPLYDPTGRLFLASEDPVPTNHDLLLKQHNQDVRLGIRSINEIRAERGLPPVPWGDKPLAYEQTGRAGEEHAG